MTLVLQERVDLFEGTVSARELCRIDWLHRELASTAAAITRFREWVRAGRPVANPVDLAFIGDDEVRAVVLEALARMPPPVMHHIVTRVLVLAVGRGELGWMAPAPPLPCPAQIIAVSGHETDDAVLAGVFAHEASHSWLEPAQHFDATAIAEARQSRNALVNLAREWGQLARVTLAVERKERRAAALARRWGFTGPGCDVLACARLARRREIRESKEMPK